LQSHANINENDFHQAAHKVTISPCAVSSSISSCSSPLLSGLDCKDLVASHKQGTPLETFLGGSYLAKDGPRYVVSNTRTPTSTHRPNLPAAPDSLLPLQDTFLALVHTCRSPLERHLATLAYLCTGEDAAKEIVNMEEAAAAIQARYSSFIAKAEQRKVSSSTVDGTAPLPDACLPRCSHIVSVLTPAACCTPSLQGSPAPTGTGSSVVAKVKLDTSFAKRALSAKQLHKKAITGSDALADPAGQAALLAPPRPQAWEARKLLAQFSKHKQVSLAGQAA
jgi:hypothetical protein